MKGNSTYRLWLCMLLIAVSVPSFAGSGVTNYDYNISELAYLVNYIVYMTESVVFLCQAIAAIVCLYAATSIYIKMNTGEEGFTKAVMMLVGGVIFMLGITSFWQTYFGVGPHEVESGGLFSQLFNLFKEIF